MALVFTTVAFAGQVVAYMAFWGYCSGMRYPDTARDSVCGAAEPVGYLLFVVVPPVAVLVGAVAAWTRTDQRILWRTFFIAVGVGLGIPLAVALAAGY